jgi:hypothetical protein
VVALAILADGTKLPVGLWLGSTETTTVVTHLVADLVDRGLDASRGLLVVIDGAKALARAVRRVFGQAAPIQRCTIHKRRNVSDHLPEVERSRVDAKLARAFADPDPDAGLGGARDLARALQGRHPGAAASLREGLEEMFTVHRLGLSQRLARTLTSTNPVESMISIALTTMRNVKRWKDGQKDAPGPSPNFNNVRDILRQGRRDAFLAGSFQAVRRGAAGKPGRAHCARRRPQPISAGRLRRPGPLMLGTKHDQTGAVLAQGGTDPSADTREPGDRAQRQPNRCGGRSRP